MKASDQILRVRRQLPQSGGTTDTTDDVILGELNHGVDETNLIVQGYKSYLNVANTPATTGVPAIFSLSSICPGFLSMAKSGVVWFDTTGKSHYLYPKTLRWLDISISNWRDQAVISGNPTWYWHDGDQLGFFPGSSQQSTNAVKDFRVHFLIKGTPMTVGTNYPFSGSNNEITALRACDNAIISYAVWKLAPANFDKEGRNSYEQQFDRDCRRAAIQIKRQWDLTSDSDYYINAGLNMGILPR